MKEKLNNRDYIYKNMQLFYEYADDEILKDVLENIIYHILNEILFNISLKDLKKLIECREKWEYLKGAYTKQQPDFKLNLRITSKINQDIKEITNKNVKSFLNNPYETIEESIFILF